MPEIDTNKIGKQIFIWIFRFNFFDFNHNNCKFCFFALFNLYLFIYYFGGMANAFIKKLDKLYSIWKKIIHHSFLTMKPMLRKKKNEVFQSIIYHFLDISTHILDNTFLILINNIN